MSHSILFPKDNTISFWVRAGYPKSTRQLSRRANGYGQDFRQLRGERLDELNELRSWFSDNLEKPTSFGRDKLQLGICWFKTEATEHISRIWEMAQILERNGIYIKKI